MANFPNLHSQATGALPDSAHLDKGVENDGGNRMRSKQFKRLAASGLLVASLVAGAAINAAPASAVATTYFSVFFTDADEYAFDDTTTYSTYDMNEMTIATTDEHFADYDTSTMTEQQASAKETPDGYLYGGQKQPGSPDYIWQSKKWGLGLSYCDSRTNTCKVTDYYEVSFREYVYGGTSHRWLLTLQATRKFGGRTPVLSYAYYCGVNKVAQSDTLCAGGGADHSESGPMVPGDTLRRHFGTASNRVFPMVRINAVWSGTGTPMRSAKMRGHDVCNTNSTTSGNVKLCSTPT